MTRAASEQQQFLNVIDRDEAERRWRGAFSIPEKILKKANKVIGKFYEIQDFDKETCFYQTFDHQKMYYNMLYFL